MNRIMRVVLSAMMVFSVMSVNVHAEEENVELSQMTYHGFEYELSNGELTITGLDENYPSEIEIPDQIDGDRVTAIKETAFFGSRITSVTIPSSVKTIGNYAFSKCWNLKSATIEGSVKSIGEGCFWMCSDLSSVTLSEGLESIGMEAFAYCESLTAITIPESVVSIGERAFVATGLKSIMIPKSVTSIADNAFEDCSNLTNIHGEKGSYAEEYANSLGKNFVEGCINHVWNAGTIKTNATCTTKGLKSYTCTVCNKTKDEVIPATGHSFNIYDKCTKCTKYASYINTSVPKMTVKSISKAKGALTVKWKKNTKVKGYEVRYSTKSNMSGSKKVKISKNKTTSKKIKSLKKKTKYYVQIRAYQTIGGKTMYSPWSAVKSQTTK